MSSAITWAGARAGAGAGARAGAWAWAWARAGAGAWAWAWAGAWIGIRHRRDWYGLCLDYDLAEERGEKVWECLLVGEYVLVECPSRWYLGRVCKRTSLTIVLEEAIMGHDLGDTGLFLGGELSQTTQLTPLPRPIEVNLGSIDTAQPYPAEYLKNIRKRTHSPQGLKQ